MTQYSDDSDTLFGDLFEPTQDTLGRWRDENAARAAALAVGSNYDTTEAAKADDHRIALVEAFLTVAVCSKSWPEALDAVLKMAVKSFLGTKHMLYYTYQPCEPPTVKTHSWKTEFGKALSQRDNPALLVAFLREFAPDWRPETPKDPRDQDDLVAWFWAAVQGYFDTPHRRNSINVLYAAYTQEKLGMDLQAMVRNEKALLAWYRYVRYKTTVMLSRPTGAPSDARFAVVRDLPHAVTEGWNCRTQYRVAGVTGWSEVKPPLVVPGPQTVEVYTPVLGCPGCGHAPASQQTVELCTDCVLQIVRATSGASAPAPVTYGRIMSGVRDRGLPTFSSKRCDNRFALMDWRAAVRSYTSCQYQDHVGDPIEVIFGKAIESRCRDCAEQRPSTARPAAYCDVCACKRIQTMAGWDAPRIGLWDNGWHETDPAKKQKHLEALYPAWKSAQVRTRGIFDGTTWQHTPALQQFTKIHLANLGQAVYNPDGAHRRYKYNSPLHRVPVYFGHIADGRFYAIVLTGESEPLVDEMHRPITDRVFAREALADFACRYSMDVFC